MSAQPGAVHLVGGGRDEDAVVPLFARFVASAETARDAAAGGPARINALLVLEEDDDESVERFRGALSRAGADVAVHAIREGEEFDAAALNGADGIFVGGGLTPAYHAAFTGIAADVRRCVSEGMPYLGFSAGAAIAADRALIGGWTIEGAAVCDEDAGEELDEVTVVDGLGLVPFTVEVHAAQWGTLARLVAAVDARLVASGFAIDEHTSVEWASGGEATIAGRGAAWHVVRAEGSAAEHAVTVTRRIADSSPTSPPAGAG